MTERLRKDTLMSMMNTGDILETIEMFTQDNLDVRTVTMGISLLDCIDPDPKKACEKIYNKITTKAADLVPAVEHISAEYGIPIINKRISVTPIAMVAGACPTASPVRFAKALDAAAKAVGVNFIGGYSALVHKGFGPGDYALIESIPQALDETELVCSSVNVGTTKAGINMDAVEKMGRVILDTAQRLSQRERNKERKQLVKNQSEVAEVKGTRNPEAKSHMRAALAEEGVLCYLFLHQDRCEALERDLPPEKFVTGFNRRLYQILLGKTRQGEVTLGDLSEGLTQDELSEFARILAQRREAPPTQADVEEYGRILRSEGGFRDPKRIREASEEELKQYLETLRQRKQTGSRPDHGQQ